MLVWWVLCTLLADSVFAQSEPLESRQWGIRNTGQTETLKLDSFDEKPIVGLPGRDIGLPTREEEKALGRLAKRKILVAVIDSGIDDQHPEFTGQLAATAKCGPGECDPKLEKFLAGKQKECAGLAELRKCFKNIRGNPAQCWKELKLEALDADANGEDFPGSPGAPGSPGFVQFFSARPRRNEPCFFFGNTKFTNSETASASGRPSARTIRIKTP